MKNYKKKYKDFFHIEFGKEFDIHHIDGNRENNDISNLLLLPKKLHLSYHTESSICSINYSPKIISVIQKGNAANDFYIKHINEFHEIYTECQKWADYKAFLMGYIPNIHNIDISNGGGY